MFRVKHSGSFDNLERFLKSAQKLRLKNLLDSYGKKGVIALSRSTPIDSGVTASSWDYEIKTSGSSYTITWTNSNIVDGVPIVILLQYGHGTGNGGYVQGRDFINPALAPIFDEMAEKLWNEVRSL